MKNGTPTMKDVAQEAGVALATVSKYYSGGSVGELYCAKVEQAAQKLGYEPNRYAKTLKNKSAPVVAVVTPNLKPLFFNAMTDFIGQALAERGARMQVYLTRTDKAKEELALRQIDQDHIDGIITMIHHPDIQINHRIPLVTIDCRFREDIPCIASDNYSGGQIAARKLAELGCQHLAFFRSGSPAYTEPDKRGAGFEAECRNLQLPCDVCWLNEEDDSPLFVEFLRSHLHSGRLDFDGIGCSTDFLALKIITIIEDLGLRVPQDVQVIGYDGYRLPVSQKLACSTIVQPLEQMAQRAVDTLFSLNKKSPLSLVCLPVTYEAGGTTRE